MTKDNWIQILTGLVVLGTPWMVSKGLDPKSISAGIPQFVAFAGAGIAAIAMLFHRTPAERKASKLAVVASIKPPPAAGAQPPAK